MRFLYLVILLLPLNLSARNIDPINAVIGDESFNYTFDRLPNVYDSETLRIITHLKYVLQSLEKTDISNLTEQQRYNRAILLSHLAKYIEIGNFPVNEFSKKSNRPNFIDSNGNICAVGFLIAETIDRETAEHINAQYQFEYIMNMDSHVLDQWLYEYGLSKLEAAMIQPSYSYYVNSVESETSKKIGWNYGLLSIGLTSSQLFLTQKAYSKKDYSLKKRQWLSITAATLGSISVYTGMMGFSSSNKKYKETIVYPGMSNIPYVNYFRKSYPMKRVVSILNISTGMISLLYNSWQAIDIKDSMQKSKLNVYSSLQYIPNEVDPIPSLSLSYSF